MSGLRLELGSGAGLLLQPGQGWPCQAQGVQLHGCLTSWDTWGVERSLCHHHYYNWALKCCTCEVMEEGNTSWKEPLTLKPSTPFCRIVRWRAATLDGIETYVYGFSFYLALFPITA